MLEHLFFVISRSCWLCSLHDSGVDVAKLLEAEQAGAMGRVVEDIALENHQTRQHLLARTEERELVGLVGEGILATYRSGVDRDGTGVGGRVGLLAVREVSD